MKSKIALPGEALFSFLESTNDLGRTTLSDVPLDLFALVTDILKCYERVGKCKRLHGIKTNKHAKNIFATCMLLVAVIKKIEHFQQNPMMINWIKK